LAARPAGSHEGDDAEDSDELHSGTPQVALAGEEAETPRVNETSPVALPPAKTAIPRY
jgi:hypothetical protein